VHALGSRAFWALTTICAVIITAIPLLYCLGVTPWMRTAEHAPMEGRYFVGGLQGFLTVFPLLSWFYIGVEALPLASEDTIRVGAMPRLWQHDLPGVSVLRGPRARKIDPSPGSASGSIKGSSLGLLYC
jgi:hypothetical protein